MSVPVQAPPDPPWWLRLVVGRHPQRTLIRACLLGVGCWLLFRHALLPVRIAGISMEPAYHDGGVNIVNRLAYLVRAPRRGEVVGVATTGPSIMYLKRIVAMPGQTVRIRQGIVEVDGTPLAEPYVRRRQPWELPERKLAADEYFLIGDNRDTDQESHVFGVVKRRKIVGPTLW